LLPNGIAAHVGKGAGLACGFVYLYFGVAGVVVFGCCTFALKQKYQKFKAD
jgi:hypothetical protein